MNNKSSSVNSMKLKKAIAASLALLILFAFTACGTSPGYATDSSSSVELNLCRSQKCMGQSIWLYEKEH